MNSKIGFYMGIFKKDNKEIELIFEG